MQRRTRADKQRASENRITYLAKPIAVPKKEVVSYGEYNSNRELIKSFVVSLLMFGLLYISFRIWR